MPQLRIYLLGNPQVKHEEQSVEIGRRKAVALLAYLSVTGKRHRRESLATLFWPDYDESSALAYLRRTLWALNQTPVGTWIDADRESMALMKDDDLALDVDAFQRHLTTCERHDHPDEALCEVCISHLTRAVELYRGDFMAGFTLEDSAAFDEWQFFQAEVLRGKATEAWESLVRCHEARGDFDKAIDCARCWLALDPLDEDAHRHLMALYARTGQRAVALRQYESCVRRLKDGMNLAPSEETVDLYRRIRSGQFRQEPAEPSQIAAPPSISVTQQPSGPEHNLPASSTPFVGRQAEIDQIKALLTSSDSRIVTLVGPGGMGKTRLALQAAREALDDFEDGAFFVPLAPLSTPGPLIQAIADALDFPFFQRESESPRDQLLNYLREKQLLLVLDNFEHLIAGAPLLSDVVQAAPGVTLLVTSRERLNLHGEWVFKIPGMRVPESSSVEGLTEYGAVQLFIQSARRAAGHFDLTDENREDVVHICHLVAGSPLGIELSASWARLLAPREIVAEIEQSLDFLTTSLRDLPERHRSLRAVFEHSWRLLENEEQSLFRRLSIFRGGFTREAAREVAGASLLHLSSLVDKSVLRRDPAGRYELHELLRQYAEEKLEAETEEMKAVREEHARYYLEWLARMEIDFKGAGQVEAAERLAHDLENVRSAWHWAVANRMTAALHDAILSLTLFCVMRSRFHDGAELFAEAVTAFRRSTPQSEEQHVLLGYLLAVRGWFLEHLYKPAEAGRLARESLDLLEPLGRRWELAFAYLTGVFGRSVVLPGSERAYFEKALEIYRECGDHWGEGAVLERLGTLVYYQDRDYAAATRYLEESLDLRRDLGDRWGMAAVLFTMGTMAQDQGLRDEAERRYYESFELRWEIGDPWGTAICLDFLGYVLRRMGKYERARELHKQSLEISRRIGDVMGIGGSLDNLGMVAYNEGDYVEAQRYFEEGLEARQKAEERYGDIAFSQEHLGDVHLAQGHIKEAAHFYEHSLANYEHTGNDVHWGFVRAYHGLGRLARVLGDDARARKEFRLALERALKTRAYSLALEVFISVAELWLDEGQGAEAVELLGAVDGHRASAYQTEQAAGDIAARAKTLLPEESFQAAFERGKEAELMILVGEVAARLAEAPSD